jgi:hypothetical protein
LRKALTAVNRHLAKHCNPQALTKAELPLRFKLVVLKDGDRVRFQAHYGAQQAQEEPDITSELAEATEMTEPEMADGDEPEHRHRWEPLTPIQKIKWEHEARMKPEWVKFRKKLGMSEP